MGNELDQPNHEFEKVLDFLEGSRAAQTLYFRPGNVDISELVPGEHPAIVPHLCIC